MKRSEKLINFYNNNKKLVMAILIVIALLVAFFIAFSAYYISNYFVSNAVINSNIDNMKELSNHDKTTIQNSIQSRVNYLQRVANTIDNSSLINPEDVVSILNTEVSNDANDLEYGLISSDGTFYSASGIQTGKSSVYNQLKTIDQTFIKRYNKNNNILNNFGNCLVIGSKIDIKIASTQFDYILGAYSLDIVQDEYDIKTYNGAGFTTVIDLDGNYIVNDTNSSIFVQSNDFFKDINSTAFNDNSNVESIKEQMKEGKQLALRGKFVLSRGRVSDNIMVITKLDNLDWYIVTFAPVEIFEEQGRNNSLTVSIIVAVIIVAIYGIALVLFINSRKRLKLSSEISNLEEAQKSHDIIEAIAENYESIYIVDFDKDTCKPIRQSDYLSEKYSGLGYHDPMVKFINEEVYLEDREKLLEVIEPEYIRKKLKSSNRFSIGYRSISENEIKFYEMHYDSTSKDNEVLLSLENRNEAYLRDKTVREYQEITSALSKEYLTIFYVNINNGTFKIFTGDPELESLSKGIQNDFFDKIKTIVCKYVHEKDVEMILKFADKEPILESLKESEITTIEFRQLIGAEYFYHRVKVTQSQDKQHLIIAIENIENEVKNRKQTKEALENALSMAEAASKAKSTFLNSMSHDIRTPMNAIIGFKNLAEKNLDDKSKVEDYLTKIGSASDHLLSLINGVLDMSRIESGKVTISEEQESLPDIINNIKNIILEDVKNKNQKLHISTFNIENENIICDKLRLNQVLLNLISNSMKYTPSGGQIKFSIAEISSIQGYATYEFRIKDNGIGMSEEFRKTIFEPFTREKTSTVSGIQGTGLGMSITKSIVDMMRGKIEVESELGVGTEFILTLMFKLAGEKPTYNDISSLNGKRALVVNGYSNNCENAVNMLNNLGLVSDSATTGASTMEKIKSIKEEGSMYRIIIVNYKLHDISGPELIKKIRKEINDNSVIILLATYDVPSIKDDAMAAGATAIINKPIFLSQLHQTLSIVSGEINAKEDDIDDEEFKFDGAKILLVEDNELNREIAQAILEEKGIIVDTAEDGSIAVDIINSKPANTYDVILMDIQMPVMNGYEATKAIRMLKDKEKATMPIIAMTANAFDEDRKHAIECGMNDHIAKPIDMDILNAALRRVINKKK